MEITGLLLAIYVLIISFTHICNETFKWYTVNMCIVYIPSNIAFIAQKITHIYIIYKPTSRNLYAFQFH